MQLNDDTSTQIKLQILQDVADSSKTADSVTLRRDDHGTQLNTVYAINITRTAIQSNYNDIKTSSSSSSLYTVFQKMHQLWNGIAKNYQDQFCWNLAQIFKRLQNRVCMFQFSHRFAIFMNFLSLKPDTENNANFDAVTSKPGNFDAIQ